MLPLHNRSVSGVATHVPWQAKMHHCSWCPSYITGLQRHELWIRLQWFMDPPQAEYCPQLQSPLPEGSRGILFNALDTVANPVGAGPRRLQRGCCTDLPGRIYFCGLGFWESM